MVSSVVGNLSLDGARLTMRKHPIAADKDDEPKSVADHELDVDISASPDRRLRLNEAGVVGLFGVGIAAVALHVVNLGSVATGVAGSEKGAVAQSAIRERRCTYCQPASY